MLTDRFPMYQDRTYRNLLCSKDLVSFRVIVKETDVLIHAEKHLEDITKELILRHRGYIENYVQRYPGFLRTLDPWRIRGPAPLIIKDMVAAGSKAGVGPMAAVAGAIAEHVGVDLLSHTNQVVVENGGDVFLKTNDRVIVGIFAGRSPLSLRIGLSVDSGKKAVSVCTSSGTVGPSLSFGKADAVCVISKSGSLSDAAATSIGNHVKSKTDIQTAVDFGKRIKGVSGIVVIADDEIGLWGDLSMVPLEGKKG